uniref:CST complex subunit CTC1 n=1 Tax=Mastacembelus armatus TaxID=205130 RepID=A0A3Q3S439_9TELE
MLVLQETTWLKEMFSFITQQVCPVFIYCLKLYCICILSLTFDPACPRPVSVFELVSQQHLACVSNLSWSTNQQRAWAREAELSLPGHRALPRVNLLLIGCLREGRGGEWRLTNSSGSVRCEVLSPSPMWLNRPVFLPHWNYIPHNALGQGEVRGCVELIGSPVVLCPGPEQGLAAAAEKEAGLSVSEAAGLLQHRVRGQRVAVCGQVGSVSPVLVVAGTSFFCFTLTDNRHQLPVRLWWSQCVCVGQSVCVTALRVCVLGGWRGNNILCVTDQSQIHTDNTLTHTPVDHTQTQSQSDTPLPMMSHDNDNEEEEPERDFIQSGVRVKQSRVISYQGMVTEVVSEGAGLYVIDRKVGLCLAYQPTLRRRLRAGDCVELHHVHFLFRPCTDFPPSMLCTCLRSTLRVTSFSRVGGSPPDSTCPGDGALPRLLLEKNVGVSEYLWACHLSSQLSHSVLKQQCVCVLSWKLMDFVWRRGRRRRDIYSEMLDEPHTCPLTEVDTPEVALCLHRSVFVSLTSLTQSVCVSVCMCVPSTVSTLASISTSVYQSSSSLYKGGVQHRLDWYNTHTNTHLPRGQRSQTAGSTNVCVPGCLVCVQQFTMVTERFLQSDFPSYQHLDQDRFITHKNCRVYLQFSLDHVHILSPSVAMVTHLRQTGEGPAGDVTDRKQIEEQEGGQTAGRKRRTGDTSVATTTQACVSMVIRVEQKDGVAWRNTGVELKKEEVGLTLSFCVQAAMIGPVVRWGRDPKNGPMADREAEKDWDDKVVLVFSGVSARWFPLLQPGCFYRLIAANTQDPSVLIGSGVSGWSGVELHTDPTLQVRSDWRFHTLISPLLLHTCRQVNTHTYCHTAYISLFISNEMKPHLSLSVSSDSLALSPVFSSVWFCFSSAHPPPAPIMHLGLWALSREQRCIVGEVKGHMICFLFLQLQWSCSVCGSDYTQSCSSSQCRSTSSVFQSKAKLVMDDGTGEAHVWFSGALVRPLLELADSQWEGLQRALRVKGHIRVYPQGQSLVCDSDCDDPLLHFLLCVCSTDVVGRPISLTCRKLKLRRFSRGDRDFMTRMVPALQLKCLHIHTD